MVAICASILFGCTGYFFLVRQGREVALSHAVAWCAGIAGVLAGGVCAALWHPGRWSSVVIICICPLLVALAVVDVAEHRLPDRMTGALALVTTLGLGVAGLAESHEPNLRRALGGAAVLGLGYVLLAFMGGGAGMGLGDVKLAPSLGALTAWFGWNTWASGAALAFLLGGLWGVLLLVRGCGLKARMPFGPFMVAGAVIALISA